MSKADKTPCRTPAEGRDGVTNIDTWKFECIRTAILAELAVDDCKWSELTDRIRTRISPNELDEIGNLGWYTISVKLEMEVREEIRRKNTGSPQIITLN